MTPLQERIIEYIKKHDRCPNYATVGTDYYEGSKAFDELFASGVLVREIKVSASGRRISVIRVAQCK